MRPQRRARSRRTGPAELVAGFLSDYCTGNMAAAPRRARGPQRGARGFDSRRIVHSASDAILSVDEHTTILLANPAAAQMFNSSVSAMQGSRLSRFIQPPSPEAHTPFDYFPAGGGRAGRRATDYAVTGIRAGGQLQKLARSHDQLRQLSSALQSIREEERTHIARELHDDLGQLLASLRMDLTLLARVDQLPDDSVRLVAGMETNLLTAIASLRRISANLRPRALDEGGLYFALQGLRDEFVERHGIACTLLADEAELRLDDAASTAVFRIVQEALTNIARHAGAQNVLLNLYRTNGELLVTIQDDGRGIRAEDMEKAQSLGLVGMRERVWGMGGDITIAGDEAPGTRIDIVLPLSGHVV